MAPEVGFEPTTSRLTAGCSTIELLWNPKLNPYFTNRFAPRQFVFILDLDGHGAFCPPLIGPLFKRWTNGQPTMTAAK